MIALSKGQIFIKAEIILVGYYKEQIASAFGAKLKNSYFTTPGVLSRKKQVIPTVTKALAANGQGA